MGVTGKWSTFHHIYEGRESSLASLYEGGVTAKAVTEGVSVIMLVHSPSRADRTTAPSQRGPRDGGNRKMVHYNHCNVKHAKQLRKEMTPWERKLWYLFLKDYPIRFQRQKCIDNYIVDFYCFRAKLVIELDGGGHYDPEAEQYDKYRTRILEEQGLKVLRFCNTDVDKNFYGVCTVIDNEVKVRM